MVSSLKWARVLLTLGLCQLHAFCIMPAARARGVVTPRICRGLVDQSAQALMCYEGQ